MIQTKPGWKNLSGLTDWLPELQQLLADARAAAQQQALKPRLDAAAYLTGFIQESSPQTPDMDRLDDLAAQAATDLMMATIDERLAAIVSRSAQYAKLEKDLTSAAERGEAAADAIRLKGIQGVIETTTQAVNAAKALASTLDESDPDEKKIAALIDKAVDAIEKLRSGAGQLL